MRTTLQPGLRHRATLAVTPDVTVPALATHLPAFGDMPPVLATAFMVGFVEATCIECLRGHLDAGEHTVGTLVDVGHEAATPVGLQVAAEVELTEVSGHRLVFRVEVSDDAGPVGRGTHHRAVVDVARFLDGVDRRASLRPGPPAPDPRRHGGPRHDPPAPT